MKLYQLLNESDTAVFLASARQDSNKPKNELKLQFFFNVRNLKAELKNVQDEKDIDRITLAINSNSKSEVFSFEKVVQYEGNRFLVFRSNSNVLWVCIDYNTDEAVNRLQNNYPVGTILDTQWGYDMIIYDFFKIVSYDKRSVVLSKLKTKDLGDIRTRHQVVPSDEVEYTKKFKLNIGTSVYVKTEHANLYFDPVYVYDKSKKYVADYND